MRVRGVTFFVGPLLGPGSQEYEETDEDEPEVVDEAEGDHGKGQEAGDGSSGLRCLRPALAHAQRSSQHAAAVHGESRQKVERSEEQVQVTNSHQPWTGQERWRPHMLADKDRHEERRHTDRQASQRADDGDCELLLRVSRDGAHLRDTSDGDEEDVVDDDSITGCDDAVTQLVGQDGSEDHGDPQQADTYGVRSSAPICGDDQEDQEDEGRFERTGSSGEALIVQSPQSLQVGALVRPSLPASHRPQGSLE